MADELGAVNGGVPRHRLLEALRNPRIVALAIRHGRCFLCRDNEVDRSGLCMVCRVYLSDEERAAVNVYYDIS